MTARGCHGRMADLLRVAAGALVVETALNENTGFQ